MTFTITITPFAIEVICHIVAAMFYIAAGAFMENDSSGRYPGAIYGAIFAAIIFTAIGAHQ